MAQHGKLEIDIRLLQAHRMAQHGKLDIDIRFKKGIWKGKLQNFIA
jgi:hypothetical protein